MDAYHQLNSILVQLFNNTMDIERKYVLKSEFKNISVNDMHILDAIGTGVSPVSCTHLDVYKRQEFGRW